MENGVPSTSFMERCLEASNVLPNFRCPSETTADDILDNNYNARYAIAAADKLKKLFKIDISLPTLEQLQKQKYVNLRHTCFVCESQWPYLKF